MELLEQKKHPRVQPLVLEDHCNPTVDIGAADAHESSATKFDERRLKQGHKCCNGSRCCDMRRAVFIVDLVNLFLHLTPLHVLLVFLVMIIPRDTLDETFKIPEWIYWAQIGTSVAGIFGAYFFNKWMVGISALAYCAIAIIAFWGFESIDNICFLIYMAWFAYPHFFLFREIHQGIMTNENYPTEESSCCM